MVAETLGFVPGIKNWNYPPPEKPIYEPCYYPELPYHLRKYVLKGVAKENGGVVPESLWTQRGIWIERRVQGIIVKLLNVESVMDHSRHSKDDLAKHDSTVKFKDGSVAYIQVKSSGNGIKTSKLAIRDAYFPGELNTEGQVNNWMTKRGIILINGSETRSDEEIIHDSFYPQLLRIVARTQEARREFGESLNRYQTVFSVEQAA
jgi:hypothetical protein